MTPTRLSPTRLTAAALAAIAFGALWFPPGVVLLAALLLVSAAAVDLRAAARQPRVDVALPSVLARGVPVDVSVVAAPDGSAAGAAVSRRVRQPFPPDVLVEPDEADDRLDSVLTGLRRGRHRLPPAAVRCTGPLRLARFDHAIGEGAEITVYPDLPAARRLAIAVRQGRFDPQGRRPRGPLGLGTEFEYVREYSPDDDIRQVNWRASARGGRPMSNQYRLDQEREVMVLIDSGRLMAAPVSGRTRLDAAVDAAVAVAAVADVLGDRCGAVAFASGVRRHVRAGRTAGRQVVDAIFDLEPLPEESDYELAFRTVGGGKRALVVVLTDLLDEAAARSLVGAVPILARRHAVIVASVTDPEVSALLRTAPTGLDDACAQAVAVDLVEGRARVTAKLARAGAAVVDAPPERLSEACVAEYLRLKARARA